MFGFARSKREAAQQNAPPKPQSSTLQQGPRPGGVGAGGAGGDSAPANPPVIADVSALRDMSHVSLEKLNLSQFRNHVACMSHPEKGLLLLVAKEIWGRPAFFDLKHRIQRQALRVALRPAEKEVVQALHDAHGTDKVDVEREDDSSIERLTDEILNQAAEMSASDIHLECRSSYAEVFFRVYGQRILKRTISREAALGMAGLMFDVRADHGAKRDIKWSPDSPIDAVIDHEDTRGRHIQIRFASAPMYPRGNFQLVCRLLKMDPQSAPPFDLLGYTSQQMDHIEEMIIGSQGLVLLVGPTNSGKSTTMQALARRILEVRGETIKIESIEDPVEYIIPGAVQMPVGARADFVSLLKSTLRHDPDVLLVGEVRDTESAESIKNIVLAGRKVLATLHAYDAMAAWARLTNIGVPPDVLFMSGFVSGIIYQRLLPKLCQHCALDYESLRDQGVLPAALVERIERVFMMGLAQLKFRDPKGCPHCSSGAPGYKGRVVCAEYVVPDQLMLDALRDGRHQVAKTHWMGMPSDTGFGPTAIGHALKIMADGLVDPRDVESQVGIIRVPQASPALIGSVTSIARASKGREVPLMGHEPAMGEGMEALYERHVA